MKNLRKMRKIMPSGYITAITGGDSAKRVALNRIFTKDSIEDLTASELAMLDEFYEYAEKYKDKISARKNRANTLAKELC